MDKILSINTIKNVFAALGAKTSDDNYGVALLDKTSGEPKGLMGMSDLASVLGVENNIITLQANASTQLSNFQYSLVLFVEKEMYGQSTLCLSTWGSNMNIISNVGVGFFDVSFDDSVYTITNKTESVLKVHVVKAASPLSMV